MTCIKTFLIVALCSAVTGPTWAAAAKAAPPQPTRAPAPFTVASPEAGFALPEIVLNYDPASKTGYDWARLSPMTYYQEIYEPQRPVLQAVRYLREAVKRMTGKELPVASKPDVSRGIVLTTLDIAPPDIKNDREVQYALRDTGEDAYNYKEAFYVRTEPNRVLIVANTFDGLAHGVVELCESVGYEILAMGPNWINTPDYSAKPLVFKMNRAGRPGFYIRGLSPTSGQIYGVGTIYMQPMPDPADEAVEITYGRWNIGSRFAGQSMPHFPGHSMQAYHKAVIEKMKELKRSEGFLTEKTTIGADADRPAASKDNAWQLWINSDATGQPGANKVYISDGNKWVEQSLAEVGANLDLSVPFVRQVVFDRMKETATEFFKKNPDGICILAPEPEDGGGYAALDKLLFDKNWYPDYLKNEGLPFGRPYVLHGYNGLNQPKEMWDSNAAADTVFGFSNWVLHEYDKWIDSLPPAERVTATAKSKKAQVRCSLYSYNYHDVPPNFNLDPRIRVMIASYPKHRGYGKWKKFVTQKDMAKAFKVMLPREPSGDYWIISLSYFWDSSVGGIVGSPLASTIHNDLKEEYDAGFRALSCEIDFNFGKMGLAYYLYSKYLWNPRLTAAQVEALRDQWLMRSFGSGWREARAYYDFIARDNYTLNAPNTWAKAIRLLDAADQKIDPAKEPAQKRRIDDVKQMWYFYYLLESGQGKPDNRNFREFAWKGQMSYTNAMHMVTRVFFKTNSPKEAAGPEFSNGAAHYTAEETAAWWAKVLDFWKLVPVSTFADAMLANGKPGKSVDVNDLVAVKEFLGGPKLDVPFLWNSGYQKPASFLTVASKPGEEIGFKFWWPWNDKDNYYRDKDVFYGIDRWDPMKKTWQPLVDKSMIFKHSATVTLQKDVKYQMAEVRYPVPQAGTYRVEVGYGGNASRLASLSYDPLTEKYEGPRPFTYFLTAEGWTQEELYIYIPKGTKSLDLEVWDTYGLKTVQLYNGLPATGMKPTRKVDVSKQGTHTVKLEPGEDGSIATIAGNGLAFPHMYSVPSLWSKGPAALLVPRAIATADGLTPR